MFKRLKSMAILFLSSMLVFTTIGPTLAFASSVDYKSSISMKEAKTLVEEGFYETLEEATTFESMKDEEYEQFVEGFEKQFIGEDGTYSLSYLDDELITNEEEVVFIEDESTIELIEDEEDVYEITPLPEDGEFELNWLPFLLPALKAIVGRSAGKAIVKQYLKKSTKWINVKNGHLAGKKHPTTGVKFSKKGFPIFNSKYTMTLSNSYLKSTNATQFKQANKALKTAVNKSSKLKKSFTKNQQKDIANGKTPRGYVWHHHQDRGKLQLVNKNTHSKTGHTGGKAIWGKN